MPAGASHPALGYAVFCGIKFAGYSLAAHIIARRYPPVTRNAWIVGGTRTFIGIIAGAIVWSAMLLLPREAAATGGVLFLLGLVPLRLAEWWLLLWLFFDRRLEQRRLGWRVAFLATLWSFALDVPTIAGLLLTGGFWIC